MAVDVLPPAPPATEPPDAEWPTARRDRRSQRGGRHTVALSGLAPLIMASLCLSLPGAGCQEHLEPSLTPGQKKKLESHVLSAAPAPQHPLGVVIEDQVRLIGYDLDREKVKPGEKVTITYYLEALSEKMGDNMIFVHFQGRRDDRRAWMNLDHHPVEGLLPLRQLQKGQIVKDVQVFTVSPEFPGGTASIYWGLWRGEQRLKVKDPGKAKVDGEGRVIVATLEVDGPKPTKTPTLPSATAVRLPADAKITLDGKLDEEAWSKAAWTPWWGPPDGSDRPAPRTRARFLWTADTVFIGVEAIDDDIWSSFTERDSNTWEQEVIEVFIDANGDKKDYLELQVTPANVIFDAKFTHHRSDLAAARAWNMEALKTAVHIDGTLNQRDDRDERYTVEMAIPVAEVPGSPSPLTHGSVWRVNLFRWDLPKSGRQAAAAWSAPVVGDFHALDRFGHLRFIDPALGPPPGATAPPAVVPAVPRPVPALTPEQLEKLRTPPVPGAAP